ncbi:hypothetical protein LCGC14_2720970 [marine sediment metagenome]|uniref:Uncharacterized protein n=1 Tax=marine sediment metagenome TaxID=412755 RepID=A0A0F8ZA05_9ZZZZ
MRHKWKIVSHKRTKETVERCECGCKRITSYNVNDRWGMFERYYIQPDGEKTQRARRCVHDP